MVAAATALREATAGLVVYANTELAPLWAQAEAVAASSAATQQALFDILPALLDKYATAAAALAASWYDELRVTTGVAGSFEAVPAEIGDLGANALVGWGTQPLLAPTPDMQATITRIEGGIQRRVANAARETVTGSSIADPAAKGWQRVGEGSCAFCQMLISRGAVYSEATADFASHDHCNCAAMPAFGGQPLPVKPYTPSPTRVSDADRARVREYLRTH